MEQLPLEIENLIWKYKFQMEIGDYKRFNICKMIKKNVKYLITKNTKNLQTSNIVVMNIKGRYCMKIFMYSTDRNQINIDRISMNKCLCFCPIYNMLTCNTTPYIRYGNRDGTYQGPFACDFRRNRIEDKFYYKN